MKRLVFILLTVLLPFLALALLEGGLRLAGFGHSYPLFVPVPQAEDWLRQTFSIEQEGALWPLPRSRD